MNYRCPKCQSTQIMPVASATGPRPVIPKSLVILVPSILILLLLVIIGIVFWIMDKQAGVVLQGLTIGAFLAALVSGAMFWKAMPDFKLSMQSFMQPQKHWKCRQCNHDWHNQ